MDDFTKRYDLIYKNAFVFRGLITQIEYANILHEMTKIIAKNNRNVDGYITTCTHDMTEDGKADTEIIIPLNLQFELNEEEKEKYKIINSIEINNCLKVRLEGNPNLLEEKLKPMMKYIDENNLEQVSNIYIVIIKDALSIKEIDNAIVEAYVQVEELI